jgi:hypothetical protein
MWDGALRYATTHPTEGIIYFLVLPKAFDFHKSNRIAIAGIDSGKIRAAVVSICNKLPNASSLDAVVVR